MDELAMVAQSTKHWWVMIDARVRAAGRSHPSARSARAGVAMALLALALGLAGCNRPDDVAAGAASSRESAAVSSERAAASAGQVSAPAAASPHGVTTYAASRFLEQASFGVTAESVAEVKRLGFAGWIDAQLATPAVAIDPSPLAFLDTATPNTFRFEYPSIQFSARVLTAPEQLRLRVAWSLSQFLVVSQQKVVSYGAVEYANFLMRAAFSQYGPLLREMTLHAAMGHYLDNSQNRAASACVGCAPNENFARELLQLFTLGVNRLNEDGTPMRDAQGRTLETYTQDDVQELARALTGWSYDTFAGLPIGNPFNFGNPMVARRAADHDDGAKRVLGVAFPAGQGAQRDLDQAIDVLVGHPNIAPFVSLRLIQHLVMSDPSPAYVRRVAGVFANDGAGRRGNLGAVVKAVLLDPDARAGDRPGTGALSAGKLREPYLHFIGTLRGLRCRELPRQPVGEGRVMTSTQRPFNAISVFSFYLPTDRAPGSLLLAPEQVTLDGLELRSRLGGLTYWAGQGYDKMIAAGCELAELEAAYLRSEDEFLDLASSRWFRGALPPTVRATAKRLTASLSWMEPRQRVYSMLSYLLTTPSYGTIQ